MVSFFLFSRCVFFGAKVVLFLSYSALFAFALSLIFSLNSLSILIVNIILMHRLVSSHPIVIVMTIVPSLFPAAIHLLYVPRIALYV